MARPRSRRPARWAAALVVPAAGFAPVLAATHSVAASTPAPGATAPVGVLDRAVSPSGAPVRLGAGERLVVRSVLRDRDGTTHVRYDRIYKGLKVIGGDLIVATTSSGRATARDNLSAPVRLGSTTASISGTSAKAAAATAAKAGGTRSARATGAEVVVHADGKAARLAYDVLVTGMRRDGTPSRAHVYVDARSGRVLSSREEIVTGTGNSQYSGTVTLNTIQSGSTWQLRDSIGNYTTDLNGSTSGTGTQFTDADNVWGNGTTSSRQTAGVDAQFGAERTYAYFNGVHGRAGIWGNGTGARSRVHYGNAYSNAFWDSTQMTYGDGAGNAKPLTELDVAAHEMSHGVTENTADLDYGNPNLGIYKESGGLNEATSDIFAAGVEFNVNSAADPGDYLVGEKIDIRGNGTPLRYMDKPSKDGSSLDCFNSSTIRVDPHYSSGPLNHWFFLASEGSGAKTVNGVSYNSPTCNGATVVGAGRVNIEKVWYRTLSTKLTSTSGYAAAREGAIASAIELYGASSQTCKSVEAAFNAITVPAGSATCGGTTPPTDPPTGANLLGNPGFESGATVWTSSSGAITNSSSRPARTGSWKLWLGGNGRTVSENASQSVTIAASATSATLSFWVRIDTAETTSSRAYDTMKAQVISGSTTTTLATYSNLSATGGAYVQKTFNLTAYKGKTITVKFLSQEDVTLQTSFVIDDVAVAAS